MLVLPISTPLLTHGDDLTDILWNAANMSSRDETGGVGFVSGDIVVVSSKALATVEGAMVDLRTLTPPQTALDLRLPSPIEMGERPGSAPHRREASGAGARALELSRQTGRSPAFCEAMLTELRRLNGKVIGAVRGAALTEVRPEGMTCGSILVANAGLDESNAPEGFAIGWPEDPVASVGRLRKELISRTANCELRIAETKKNNSEIPARPAGGRNPKFAIGLIITDSVCIPRRSGVTAIALTVSGLDPLQSMRGRIDLFGKPLQITTEAIADQLATAGNFLMGNAAQSIPAVIIRNHGLTLSDWEGWVPGIEPEQDLFRSLSEEQNIKHIHWRRRAPGG